MNNNNFNQDFILREQQRLREEFFQMICALSEVKEDLEKMRKEENNSSSYVKGNVDFCVPYEEPDTATCFVHDFCDSDGERSVEMLDDDPDLLEDDDDENENEVEPEGDDKVVASKPVATKKGGKSPKKGVGRGRAGKKLAEKVTLKKKNKKVVVSPNEDGLTISISKDDVEPESQLPLSETKEK